MTDRQPYRNLLPFMHIPSPQELGFPDKYESWRPQQEDALRGLLQSQKRVKGRNLPTGSGKSGIGVAYALLSGIPTAYVTESRGLQDQLMADFEQCGAVDLRGRRNYQCEMKPDYTCEDGYAARCPYKGQVACPASQSEMRAAVSPLVITNYDKLTKTKLFGGLQHIQQIIFDEGDQAPLALARAMRVTLQNRELESIPVTLENSPDEMVNWKPWAAKARVIAEERATRLKSEITSAGQHAKLQWIKDFLHYQSLSRRLALLSTSRPENWVVEEFEDERGRTGGYVFDPIRVGQYGESALMMQVPSVLFMSATLREKTLWMVGVGRDQYDYKEYDSTFDPRRSPVYYVPTMRVDSRATDLTPVWIKLDQIAGRRQDRRGLVQTISFARRDEIKQKSRFAPKMLINQRGEAPRSTIEEYRQSEREGTILVSPSFSAGYDFPGQECEWQFVCKIPFPQSTKIIKARQHDDPEYGYYIAMNKLVQIFGRAMRFPGDQCENFIVDSHMDWFYPRYKHLAPKWFRAFFKETEHLPGPPPRL